MAKPKTMIIYAAMSSIAMLSSEAAVARERGQAVRFIALEEFRGETEQNAGAVYVERRSGDDLIFDRIQQCYPMIVVQDLPSLSGGTLDLDLDDHGSFAPEPAPDDLRELRLQLIGLGGSAPAGADAEELARLIAAQKLEMHRHPILPNAATAGTVIPDATPIVQRPDAEKLLDAGGVGTSQASIAASDDITGGHATGEGTSGTASGSTAAGTAGGENSTDTDTGSGDDVTVTDEDKTFAETFIDRGLDAIGEDEFTALTPGQKAAVIAAESDREKPRVTLLRQLGVEGEASA